MVVFALVLVALGADVNAPSVVAAPLDVAATAQAAAPAVVKVADKANDCPYFEEITKVNSLELHAAIGIDCDGWTHSSYTVNGVPTANVSAAPGVGLGWDIPVGQICVSLKGGYQELYRLEYRGLIDGYWYVFNVYSTVTRQFIGEISLHGRAVIHSAGESPCIVEINY